jgi:hypothetical protein
MTSPLNIGEEIAQVQRELRIFRQEYLPILAEPVPIDDRWAYVGMLAAAPGPNARIWEEAAFSIADTLPLPPDDPGKAFNPEDYAGLYHQAQDPGFQIRDGKIVWEISIFMPVLLADGLDRAAPYGVPYRRVDQIVDWLLSLPLDDARLWNSLCILLPVVAMQDEQRAWELLNPQFWANRLSGDENWTPLKDSKMDAEEYIRSVWFNNILNNSMLHVLAALANNRFIGIARFLQLETYRGGYTKLMPAYLFSVFCEKVLILKQLIA